MSIVPTACRHQFYRNLTLCPMLDYLCSNCCGPRMGLTRRWGPQHLVVMTAHCKHLSSDHVRLSYLLNYCHVITVNFHSYTAQSTLQISTHCEPWPRSATGLGALGFSHFFKTPNIQITGLSKLQGDHDQRVSAKVCHSSMVEP